MNYDLGSSPVALTVPAAVAEAGTSNSTQYALLTNGSLYAWGLGNEGQLGDGTMHTTLTPVRVASGATMISSTANDVVVTIPGTA